MKTFQIYKHPTLGSEVVKVGFSWPAFFFGLIWIEIIWMLVCKLWGKAALWFVLHLIVSVVETTVDTASGDKLHVVRVLLVVGYFALWLIPAFQGNAWRISNLLSRGYDKVTTIEAANKDAAIAQANKAGTA